MQPFRAISLPTGFSSHWLGTSDILSPLALELSARGYEQCDSAYHLLQDPAGSHQDIASEIFALIADDPLLEDMRDVATLAQQRIQLLFDADVAVATAQEDKPTASGRVKLRRRPKRIPGRPRFTEAGDTIKVRALPGGPGRGIIRYEYVRTGEPVLQAHAFPRLLRHALYHRYEGDPSLMARELGIDLNSLDGYLYGELPRHFREVCQIGERLGRPLVRAWENDSLHLLENLYPLEDNGSDTVRDFTRLLRRAVIRVGSGSIRSTLYVPASGTTSKFADYILGRQFHLQPTALKICHDLILQSGVASPEQLRPIMERLIQDENEHRSSRSAPLLAVSADKTGFDPSYVDAYDIAIMPMGDGDPFINRAALSDHSALSAWGGDMEQLVWSEITRPHLTGLVTSLLRTLTPREKTVLNLRYGLGLYGERYDVERNQLQVTEELKLGVSRAQVGHIVASALRKMRHRGRSTEMSFFYSDSEDARSDILAAGRSGFIDMMDQLIQSLRQSKEHQEASRVRQHWILKLATLSHAAASIYESESAAFQSLVSAWELAMGPAHSHAYRHHVAIKPPQIDENALKPVKEIASIAKDIAQELFSRFLWRVFHSRAGTRKLYERYRKSANADYESYHEYILTYRKIQNLARKSVLKLAENESFSDDLIDRLESLWQAAIGPTPFFQLYWQEKLPFIYDLDVSAISKLDAYTDSFLKPAQPDEKQD